MRMSMLAPTSAPAAAAATAAQRDREFAFAHHSTTSYATAGIAHARRTAAAACGPPSSVPPWLGRPVSYDSLQVFRGQLAVRRDPSGVHPPHQLAVVVRAQHAQRGERGMLEDVDDERDQQEDG